MRSEEVSRSSHGYFLLDSGSPSLPSALILLRPPIMLLGSRIPIRFLNLRNTEMRTIENLKTNSPSNTYRK